MHLDHLVRLEYFWLESRHLMMVLFEKFNKHIDLVELY